VRFDKRQHVLIAYFTEYRLSDEHLIKQTADELDELVGKVPDGKRLVLDFTAVRSVSSEMVGVLVVFNTNCKVANVELRFRNISPAVMKVLRMARLDKVFEIAGPTESM
jgi:anti-anti-sigma factor